MSLTDKVLTLFDDYGIHTNRKSIEIMIATIKISNPLFTEDDIYLVVNNLLEDSQ